MIHSWSVPNGQIHPQNDDFSSTALISNPTSTTKFDSLAWLMNCSVPPLVTAAVTVR